MLCYTYIYIYVVYIYICCIYIYTNTINESHASRQIWDRWIAGPWIRLSRLQAGQHELIGQVVPLVSLHLHGEDDLVG